MKKQMMFNIIKHTDTKYSPFEYIIYVLKNSEKILIEHVTQGITRVTEPYDVRKILRVSGIKTGWKRTFNHGYVKFEDESIEHFIPLFSEKIRFATLTFKINKNMLPNFRTKEQEIKISFKKTARRLYVDNTIREPELTKETTYKYLYENIKNYENKKFKLELVDTDLDGQKIYDDNHQIIKTIMITCTVPILQLYAQLTPIFTGYNEDTYDYNLNLLVMKCQNNFYRFPYGNIRSNDRMCLGHQRTASNKQPFSIADKCYAHIITSYFNGDYIPCLQYDNTVQTTLNIDLIREKINQNNFKISFIDMLLYLSSCKTMKDINLGIFILSPNVHKEIQRFENCDQIDINSNEEIDQINPVELPQEDPVNDTHENTSIQNIGNAVSNHTSWSTRGNTTVMNVHVPIQPIVPIELLNENNNEVTRENVESE